MNTVTFVGPLSAIVGAGIKGAAGSPDLQSDLYHTIWWIQYGMILCFLLYVLYSDHQHAVFVPFQILFSRPGQRGILETMLLDEASGEDTHREENQGRASGLENFSRGRLLSLYGCTQCGRCQDVCPAFLSEKPLSPKKVNQDLKRHMDEGADLLLPWKIKGKKTTAVQGPRGKWSRRMKCGPVPLAWPVRKSARFLSSPSSRLWICAGNQ